MSGSPPEDRRRREERDSGVGDRTFDRTQSPPYRAPPPYRPRLDAPGPDAPATPPPPPMPGDNQNDDNQQPGDEQPNNQGDPVININMPADPGAVNPQQLTSLPVFNGDRGEGFVNWLECLETARQTYNWAEDSLVSVAKAKGGALVAEWDRANRIRDVSITHWADRADGTKGFRHMLIGRFGPKATSASAVLAVSNLQQGAKETCASFMDRVVLAVDKLNFNVTAETKNTDGYKQMLKCSILAHFGAGLRDSIGKVILGAANPPDTVAAMLLAAEAVELEQAKLGAPGTSVLAVAEPSAKEELPEKSEIEKLTEQMTEMVAAVKGTNQRSNRCYNCNTPGHFRRDCPQPPRAQGRGRGRGSRGSGAGRGSPARGRGVFVPYSGYRGRGRGSYGGGYGGYSSGYSNYPRGQFAVEHQQAPQQQSPDEPQLYTFEEGVTYDEQGYESTNYAGNF